jgi:hypothetical protein
MFRAVLPCRKHLCTLCVIILKRLPLCGTKLMVNAFGIIGSLLAVKRIAFWGVVPCNVEDYTNFA